MIDRISTKFINIYESKLNNAEIACINPKYAVEYARYNCLDRFELGESVIVTIKGGKPTPLGVGWIA